MPLVTLPTCLYENLWSSGEHAELMIIILEFQYLDGQSIVFLKEIYYFISPQPVCAVLSSVVTPIKFTRSGFIISFMLC